MELMTVHRSATTANR